MQKEDRPQVRAPPKKQVQSKIKDQVRRDKLNNLRAQSSASSQGQFSVYSAPREPSDGPEEFSRFKMHADPFLRSGSSSSNFSLFQVNP